MHDGRIKAVWIACTNPAQSMPELERVREALARCDFVVLQEAYGNTETAPFADLLLPAATWGEKEGTVTNSERRITHVNRAIPAPADARADWAIVCDFARALGPLIGKPEAERLFDYVSPEAIFAEHVETTRGRDLDITGLSYALLDAQGPQQWPFPQGAAEGRARLYVDGGFPTANGKARFVVPTGRLTADHADARFPLRMTTGRLRDQWHGMSRTGTAAQLFGHVEEAALSLHPDELQRRRLASGDLVKLRSRRGSLILPVQADDSIRPGQAFLPMHWGDRFLKGLGTNVLTLPAFDPLSKQPELKHAGIEVEKVDLPWQLFALVEGDVQRRFAALRPLFEEFAYASLTLAGRERPALVIRAASAVAPDASLLAQVDALLGVDAGPVLAYDDPRRTVGKRVRIEDGRIVAIRLAGETAARHWLKSLWSEGKADADLRRWVLAPLSTPPGATTASSGKTLCNCMNVSEDAVCAGIARGLDLDGLKQELGCGSSCGSCVPEIKRLLAAPSGSVAANA
jgi:assimilatory nitrate reductase catalytic subunit